MLTVACVQTGNYCGSGAEYVNRLFAGVSRWLPRAHRFVCFTDDFWLGYHPAVERRPVVPGVRGWFNKLALFRSGEFHPGERVLFLDLDTLVVGPLEQIAWYQGEFAILRDFYRFNGYGSGVMAWRGGFGAHIWRAFEMRGFPEVQGGDQAFIEQTVSYAHRLQDLFPGQIVSFKQHCLCGIPPMASLIAFHGSPKPHDGPQWVRDKWGQLT